MQMPIPLFLLAIGFGLLVKGADYLVNGSSSMAKRLNVSEIMIGLTVVAFGTSAPELIVNIFAGISGNDAIAFGNIIGSNITNILLILGVAGVINPIITEKNTVWKEIPFSLLAAVVLMILCNDVFFKAAPVNLLSRGDALVLLLFFIVFLTYTFGIPKVEMKDEPEVRLLSMSKTVIYILVGLIALFLGGKLVVDNAIKIARVFLVSEKLIGLTIVALGTSLPELFTSAYAAFKGKSDIAMGNVVGSNIFNLFFILGITGVIHPLSFDRVLNFDFLVLIGVSLLLFLTMFTGKRRRLDRWEAIVFLLLYISYITILIVRK